MVVVYATGRPVEDDAVLECKAHAGSIKDLKQRGCRFNRGWLKLYRIVSVALTLALALALTLASL